jgi:hypothetical protein
LPRMRKCTTRPVRHSAATDVTFLRTTPIGDQEACELTRRVVNSAGEQFAVSAKSTTSTRWPPLKSCPDGARMNHLRSEKGDVCEHLGR